MESVTGVLIAVLIVLIGITFSHPAETWSYAVFAPKDEDLIKELNRAGSMGWEVVSARRATGGEGSSAKASYEMILKRRALPGLPDLLPLP